MQELEDTARRNLLLAKTEQSGQRRAFMRLDTIRDPPSGFTAELKSLLQQDEKNYMSVRERTQTKIRRNTINLQLN